MPAKRYPVILDRSQRDYLLDLIVSGTESARKLTRGRILLKADEGEFGPAYADKEIKEAVEVSIPTIERTRKTFALEGLTAALTPKKRSKPSRPQKFDGEKEAHLIALACSEAPEGHARWTLRLLAEKMVELNHFSSVSHETIRRTLKKNALSPWLKQQWCIPPKASAEFVAAMENVLDLYHRPEAAAYPLVCVDETSKQHIQEVRQPLGTVKGSPSRYDAEYQRNGVSNLFMIFAPLQGFRHVEVTDQRTSVDFAHICRDLVDVHFRDTAKIMLVCDNLNTHKPASLYKAFPPDEARRIAEKIEFHYTPKHGSWLNMAEIELSVLSRQCLSRRIADQATLQHEIQAWQTRRNEQSATVKWQFTTDDARIKLKKLYPSL